MGASDRGPLARADGSDSQREPYAKQQDEQAANKQLRSFWAELRESWEDLNRPTEVPVTECTVAGLLIVAACYATILMQLCVVGRASAAASKPELPMLSLQSGALVEGLREKYDVADSEVL